MKYSKKNIRAKKILRAQQELIKKKYRKLYI